MRYYLLLVALVLAMALVITGCSQAKEKDNPTVTSGSWASPTEQTTEQITSGNADSTVPKDENQIGQPKEGSEDLVLKSDNYVTAGSKQGMVNELDKEINALVESLNNLDTISDTDLNID